MISDVRSREHDCGPIPPLDKAHKPYIVVILGPEMGKACISIPFYFNSLMDQKHRMTNETLKRESRERSLILESCAQTFFLGKRRAY